MSSQILLVFSRAWRLLAVRFRSGSEHLQGVERLAIMKPEATMLERDYSECDRLPSSHFVCN